MVDLPLKTTGQVAAGGSNLQQCCGDWWSVCPPGGLWDSSEDV